MQFVKTLREVVTENTDLKAAQGFDKLQGVFVLVLSDSCENSITELCGGEPETRRTDLPLDYEKTFVGDTDENFCTGVKFMKKALSM